MFEAFDIALLIKIPLLALFAVYALFALVVVNKVKSLGNMVFISNLNINSVLTFLAIVHLVLAVSLFVISLVIL